MRRCGVCGAPRNAGEVIDPYVTVRVHGVPRDTTAGQSTGVVDDNGFNPNWEGRNNKFLLDVGAQSVLR